MKTTKKLYTYNQLQILHTILEEGNYTNAAAKLGMSQSAISQSMKRLEGNLGLKLFTQRGKHLVPTDYCLKMGDIINNMLEAEEALNDLIIKGKKVDSNVLKVGLCNPMPGTAILEKFNELFPELRIEVYFGNFKETFNRIIDKQVDVGILANVPNDSRFKIQKCATQNLVALCSPKHPLATKDTISLKDITTEKVIFRTEGSATQRLIDEALVENGISLTPTYIVTTQQSVQDVVRQNLGIGFAWSESAFSDKGFIKLPIVELKKSYDEVIFCLNDNHNKSVAALMNSTNFVLQ